MANSPAIFLLTALRNEEKLVTTLLTEIHEVFLKSGMLVQVRLVIVDDHSVDNTVQAIHKCVTDLVDLKVELITLTSNRGNQSAMAYGLRKIAPKIKDGILLTFDADGEDDLTRLPELVEMLDQDPSRMVFVYRESREDGILIQIFYAFYKVIYRLFTGQTFLPCNLMAVPGHLVCAISASPLLPLHFSYPALRLCLPYRVIAMARRQRYGGQSSQNLGMLVQHALSGLTVFYEQVVARVILLSGLIFALMSIIATFIFTVRILAPQALPIGLPTLVFQFLFGFGFLSIVLFVLFCLTSSILRLLIEQGRKL